MANQKFAEWDSLRRALIRSKGIIAAGKVATILLEAFVENAGKLKVSMCRARGLCLESGEFYEWRRILREKSWLAYDTDEDGKLKRYYPGKRLLPYVNREKQVSYELATRGELDLIQSDLVIAIERKADKQDVDGLASEVSHLRKVVEALIEKYDPPVTKQKVDTALVLVKK